MNCLARKATGINQSEPVVLGCVSLGVNAREQGMEDTMQHEVARSRGVQDEWRVEAIDHEGEGAVYVTLFSGHDAQQRAEEYAAWKNAPAQARRAERRPAAGNRPRAHA